MYLVPKKSSEHPTACSETLSGLQEEQKPQNPVTLDPNLGHNFQAENRDCGLGEAPMRPDFDQTTPVGSPDDGRTMVVLGTGSYRLWTKMSVCEDIFASAVI